MKPPSPREEGLHPKQHLKGQQDEGYHCVRCRCRPHLALTSLPLASCVLLLLLPLLPLTWAYPSYLLNPDGCRSQKLEVGFDIMGSPVVEEKALKESPIVVLRGDTALHSGSEYKSGETLSVKLEGRAGMYCMEVRGGAAMFSGGACDGTRVTEPDVLALPIGDKETLQTVTLHVGLASRYGPVTLLPPFVLHPPGKGGDDPAPSEEEGREPVLSLVLPPSLPRLEKTVLVERESGMELSWTVEEGGKWVDIQVAAQGPSWVGVGVIEGRNLMVTTPPHEHGRPQMEALVRKWCDAKGRGQGGWEEETWSVVACGPEGLVREARDGVIARQQEGIKVAFHEEVFHW
ncbi:hypothetical protein NSK_008762 [Nannochloropsis salina CCMP1776]|uniref:Uncharacterized protein n=1 Tax=Nannochloropsis salina CCMP1776 TaxID=1027361 RepID=A0A4D9CQK9_9STRA|nr:hypothetical protein NSK_008762 [Nannochloropsis salina CCMP1776]|eukprot:TFJ79905.1 hypothetical protein NSK_008762 [Nannochloropsis salina CCMP1776]